MDENEERIMFPQLFCLACVFLRVFVFFGTVKSPNPKSIIINLISLIAYLTILHLIIKGINEKNFAFYKWGFLISLICNILIIPLLIILLIATVLYNPKDENEKHGKKLLIIFLIISTLLDCLLTLMLFLFKKKVKNICERSKNLPNLITNKTPLEEPK